MQQYLAFLEDNDLGTFGLTLPAQSFNAFRHRFMHHNLIVYKDEALAALARRSYFGGRCEAFRIGEFNNEPFYQLDVNSLYPFVMRNHQYPIALVCLTEKRSYLDKACFGDIGKCIADVVVATELPVVPYRTKQNLIFPVGTFETTLAGPELALCWDLGLIKQIKRIAVFDTADIFTEYVDFFYHNRLQAKANGDKARDYLHKLFLNSLYGKFGQKQQRMRVIAEEPGKSNEFWYEYETESGKTKKFVRLNGAVIEYSDYIESHYAIPHIASFVTSYARVHLLRLILAAGWRNVYYVDTDSLIVNVEGFARLREFIDESKLGYLKLELVSDRLAIYGAKAYELGDKIKMRGIRADATRIDENDARRYKTYEFFSLMRNLARGLSNAVIERHFVKQAFREYRKGNVGKDGFVEPIRF
jgi:DNA polymerase elongation subunit (family B)